MAKIRPAKASSVKNLRKLNQDDIYLKRLKQGEYNGEKRKYAGRVPKNGSYADSNSELLVESEGSTIAISGNMDRSVVKTINKNN